jgi:hypothetical protein
VRPHPAFHRFTIQGKISLEVKLPHRPNALDTGAFETILEFALSVFVILCYGLLNSIPQTAHGERRMSGIPLI